MRRSEVVCTAHGIPVYPEAHPGGKRDRPLGKLESTAVATKHIFALAALVACSACNDRATVSPAPSFDKAETTTVAGQTASDAGGSRANDVQSVQPATGKNKMRFYHVKGMQVWGDYGDVLVNGFVRNNLDRRASDSLKLTRAGPFMPPITFPGALVPVVVVSDRFRQEMSKSGFGQWQFRPVLKDHIVELHWEQWNRSSSPPTYPEGGEPEDYLSAPHSPKAADALGELWELVLRTGATIDANVQFSPSGQLPLAQLQIRVHQSTWNGDQIFLGVEPNAAPTGVWILVSETGKKWLEEHAKEWVSFEECSLK